MCGSVCNVYVNQFFIKILDLCLRQLIQRSSSNKLINLGRGAVGISLKCLYLHFRYEERMIKICRQSHVFISKALKYSQIQVYSSTLVNLYYLLLTLICRLKENCQNYPVLVYCNIFTSSCRFMPLAAGPYWCTVLF